MRIDVAFWDRDRLLESDLKSIQRKCTFIYKKTRVDINLKCCVLIALSQKGYCFLKKTKKTKKVFYGYKKWHYKDLIERLFW